MTIITRSALVPYTQRQMFELVDAIEDYPQFLPWCHKTEIFHRTEKEVEASIDIAWKGIHKSFTTRNHLHPDERMELELVSGPFKHLEGRWAFIALNEKACKVCLDLEIAFSGGVIDKLFQPVFNHIANTLVDAFCKRAVEVYGKK